MSQGIIVIPILVDESLFENTFTFEATRPYQIRGPKLRLDSGVDCNCLLATNPLIPLIQPEGRRVWVIYNRCEQLQVGAVRVVGLGDTSETFAKVLGSRVF
jgi:hypothetical protein